MTEATNATNDRAWLFHLVLPDGKMMITNPYRGFTCEIADGYWQVRAVDGAIVAAYRAGDVLSVEPSTTWVEIGPLQCQ